jgi:hypothetical protein
MTLGAKDRAQALLHQATLCLDQAKVAATPTLRDELVTLAATFQDLANSTALHDFGAVMQAVSDDVVDR